MTQQSKIATNPGPAVKSEVAEDTIAESLDASTDDHSVSAQTSAVDRAFDEEANGNSQKSQEEARIGRVVSVSGSQVIVMLENQSLQDSQGPGEDIQIGGLVKMRTPASTVFGMVSGLSIPIPSEDANESEMQIVQLELVGELIEREDVVKAVFQRGV